jgi:hypothetical protein
LAHALSAFRVAEETVGFGDRFLDGGSVHVEAEGRTFSAPPELEFEGTHFDEDVLLSVEGFVD